MKDTVHPMRAEIDKILADHGGLYEFDDIVALVRAGQMQSHVLGESWAVTQICEFPRKKVLDIVFMAGKLEELELLEADLLGFAREHGATLATANGRLGFLVKKFPGWKMVSATFVKDLSDGS